MLSVGELRFKIHVRSDAPSVVVVVVVVVTVSCCCCLEVVIVHVQLQMNHNNNNNITHSNCPCRREFDSLQKGMGMGIIHAVGHVHEYIMSFQVFPQKCSVHCLKTPSGSLLLHLLNCLSILESCLECSCLLN